jgi:AAA+ ATPase superfamily predicted ATPase
MKLLDRHDLQAGIESRFRSNPVVLLLGPRQCGKTTLAREFARRHAVEYFDLEAPAEACFWNTQGEAELDLLLFVNGKRYGFEFKYADAPSVTSGQEIVSAQRMGGGCGDRGFEIARGESCGAPPMKLISSL